jgi:hypothetical protein
MEDVKRSQLSVRIPEDLHQQVKVWCVINRVSIQDFVAEAMQLCLGKKEEDKQKQQTNTITLRKNTHHAD